MVEWNHGDKVGERVVDGSKCEGVYNNGHESDDDSSNSSLSTLELDEDLTTDGNTVTIATVQNNESANFGNIAVKNSTDIHFGNKTFYHGPVTIKQFVYASGKEEKELVGNDLVTVTTGDVSSLQYPEIKPRTEINNDTQVTKEDHQLGQCDLLKSCLSRRNSRSQCIIWLLGFVIAILLTIATLVLVLSNSTATGRPRSKITNDNLNQGEGTYNKPRTAYDVTLSGKLRILTCKDWLAQPPVGETEKLELPVPYVIISHTATYNCSSQADCTYFVRMMQTFHIESKGWNDIAYNFLIGGDGYVYQGRGWDDVGAHAYGYNVCSIGIAFIGTFLTVHPPANQFLAAKQLIAEGVKLGKIREDYRLIGHRQVSATESPGQALFDDIKALPHWSEKPVNCGTIASEINTVPNKK